jgi:hypothetical protein
MYKLGFGWLWKKFKIMNKIESNSIAKVLHIKENNQRDQTLSNWIQTWTKQQFFQRKAFVRCFSFLMNRILKLYIKTLKF